MKKLFLTIMIAAGFVLASCGTNDLANKSSDVSFSISASEVGRYIASREGETSGAEPIVFEVVAQIKGSKGYYAWIRKQAVYTPKTQGIIAEGQDGQSSQLPLVYEGGIPADVKANFEQDLVFNFKGIPAKQTYKVMIDILTKDPAADAHSGANTEGPEYWAVCFSGTQEDVSVIPGASNPVTVELEEFETNPDVPGDFAIKVTYTKDNKSVTEEVPFTDIIRSAKYSFARDNNNKYWFCHAGREWYEVSAMKLVFAQDSHFIDGSKFRIVGTGTDVDTNGNVTVTRTTLKEAQSGELDLIQFYSETDKEDLKSGCYIEFESFIKNNTSILFNERFEFNISSSKNNFGNYNTDYNSKFVKDTSIEDHDRFRLTIPLTDILGTDPLEKGDTVVFMLSSLNIYGLRNTDNLEIAYQLQKEGWESLTPEAKDADNTTINYSEIAGDKVCAANFIDGDEKYFQLYLDADDEDFSDDVTELNGSVSMSYKIFPASEKVYVFHKACASWTESGSTVKDHRKEMIYKLNNYFENLGKWPALNSKISINISGTFMTLANDTEEAVVREAPLKAELFDNLKFGNDNVACGIDGHNTYYHTLSNSSASGNTFNSLVLSENGTLGSIIFAETSQPHNTTEPHDYRLQLYKSGGNNSDNDLLIIKNFSISVAVEGGSNSPDVTAVDVP